MGHTYLSNIRTVRIPSAALIAKFLFGAVELAETAEFALRTSSPQFIIITIILFFSFRI